MTVAKLRGARERMRRKGVKCEGRKSYAEQGSAARQWWRWRRPPKNRGGRVSLREVAAELAAQGYTTPSGKPYSASALQSMVGKPAPRDTMLASAPLAKPLNRLASASTNAFRIRTAPAEQDRPRIAPVPTLFSGRPARSPRQEPDDGNNNNQGNDVSRVLARMPA
jgi:hypothetical protein